MTDRNQERTNRSLWCTEDELDRALDAALTKYAEIEPRAGLEERILANLRIARQESPSRFWFRWKSAIAVVAIVVIGAVLAWRSGMPSHPVIANYPLNATPVPQSRQMPQFEANNSSTIHPQHNKANSKTIAHRIPHSVHASVIAAKLPKLDQFPSPQPLSEQEKILANYIAGYPEQAALIAQARMEALQHDEEERKTMNGGDRNSPR